MWALLRLPRFRGATHAAGCGKSARPVVCPAKAGMFSRRQTCRGNSQEPRSLDSRVAGNQDSEAYRQGLPWGDHESPGRNESERASGLENEWIRGSSLQLKGEGSMARPGPVPIGDRKQGRHVAGGATEIMQDPSGLLGGSRFEFIDPRFKVGRVACHPFVDRHLNG
jgi:hypothetical protein